MEIGCFYLSVKMAVGEGKYKTEDEAIDVAYNAGIRCFDLESTLLTDGTTPEALAEKIKKHSTLLDNYRVKLSLSILTLPIGIVVLPRRRLS